MIEKIKELVKKKDSCVMATVSGTDPYCSLMAYVTDDACREFYMVTQKSTNKYRNLEENPSVSLLIDTRDEHAGALRPEAKAVTAAGVFQRVADEGKKGLIRARLLERHPHLGVFFEDPDAEILCIKVHSFLLLDGLTKAHFERI
jgi:nitroimidazol reductase NimA-like FMN-containing flavoprotein (pyridoxamine 5'-phosphate oxidase superfamily)